MKLVISASECAKVLSTSPNTVQKLLADGEIPAYRQGREWKIPVKALEDYVVAKAQREAEERRKSGK